VPTATLPGDATWTAEDDHHVTVTFGVDGHGVTLHHDVGDDGLLRVSWFERWGDPDTTSTWARHRFGVEVTAHRRFGGVTIPSSGRAGWHYGTHRWSEGVFFEYEIRDHRLIGSTTPSA
jgi:hypothetical protein